MLKAGNNPDKLFLAMNLGNTNLNLGFFREGTLIQAAKIPLDSVNSDEAWRGIPGGLLPAVTWAVMAGVNPPKTELVLDSVTSRLKAVIKQIGPDLAVPVVAEVDNPEQVGVDRLLDVLAAFQRTRSACLVCDCGTAITINVCSREGHFLGGIIAPGLRTAASSLHHATALLPVVEIACPGTVTGRNTIEAIRSGVFWGTVSMVEGLVARLRTEHPEIRRVLATGGDAALLTSATTVIDELDPHLTLEGIHLAARAAGFVP